MSKKAIIAGASGLTGSSLLEILLHEPGYDEVLILVRKELPLQHPKLKQLVVDFDKLDSYAHEITGDVIFSCLGSTRKKTPDLKIYRKIDHDYPVQLAQIALKNKIGQFHLVSSMGADAGASNFYTKMKGETEDDLKKVGLPSLQIYRPAFIKGDRKEHRSMEGTLTVVMKLLDHLLIGSLKKYRSISAPTIARAMFNQSLKNTPGVHTYLSDKIKELS
ncbi:NAD(P)H-binding protein [Mucilaginibacter sp. BJC16-A38]|uniref:NAD(P)H-binding protein n=1 Tax=Mucilaginibacter phenanthrenivorans TaxID=1234842 RepID=UPI002158564A|nr:NAD(P)H-binding protein [Mucilaginibacter phenanthrenivorans]MCR8560970.1 NAD(P)H-binding protein [Mucilaginibacter phenanthrenivorans]